MIKKTLVIDNYDSFVFNLVQYIGEQDGNPVVFRNDEITLEEIQNTIKPTHIVISPGPGHPADPAYFGVSQSIIQTLGKTTPVFGVCLGHQGIITSFGGEVVKAPQIMHGKTSIITHDGKGLFANIPSPFTVMRYHSLCGQNNSLPECLEVSAQTEDGVIMGIRHKNLPIEGVQFHPESIGTEYGKMLIANFLNQ